MPAPAQSSECTVIPRTQHCVSKTDIDPSALIVLNQLERAGYKAYLVGGCIRDLLLRHVPKDFDVVTNARPQQIKQLFHNCRLIGRRFRLAHVYFGRHIIEVATFRGPGRHTSKNGMIVRDNVYGDMHEDVWRRDFTINALYYSISDASIIDFTGGHGDLKAGTIRLIGEPSLRYIEDPVRLLRAIRQAAKLDFHLEAATKAGIYQHAQQLALVSPSRLLNEVIKLYHSGKAHTIHQMLCQYGLFEHLFPLTHALLIQQDTTATTLSKFIEHSLQTTDQRIAKARPVSPAFIFAVFLWRPLQQKLDQPTDNHLGYYTKIERSIREVLIKQNKHINIPKRFAQIIREIWLLQFRFTKCRGLRPFRTLAHPRFRAAYDFLLLRQTIGEAPPELVQWWTEFSQADEDKQKAMAQFKAKESGKQPTQHQH